MTFKIEKGVELPSKGSGRPAKYPFKSMVVGDSFLVKDPKIFKHVSSAAFQFGKRHSAVFTTRSSEDGLRVWRLE